MEYRNFGHSGLKVSRICIGTAFRGKDDPSTCVRTIHKAMDLGCNFFDCANTYRNGESEKILGKAIEGRRHEVVIGGVLTLILNGLKLTEIAI